jgi:hypothetical protein
MRHVLIALSLFGLASCSSVNKTGHEETDKMISHLSKGPTIVGKDWESKFQKDGFLNGEYVAIGRATHKGNQNGLEGMMRVKAEADATKRLLTSAPTQYKKIVQRAINTVNGDEGEVQESDIRVTEVRALTGLASNFDDTQCVKTAIPTEDMKFEFVKECRVIMRVPASNLMKAYDYTLEAKYGIKKQNMIEEVLREELKGSKPSEEQKPVASSN